MTIVFRRLAVINKSFFQSRDQVSATHNHFLIQSFFFLFKKERFKIFAERYLRKDIREWNKIKKYGKTMRRSGRKEICGEGAED